MERIKLSEHFYLDEFTQSQTATRNGIDNDPTPEHARNLAWLCENVLEPVRAHFTALDGEDRSVMVSSGYRSPELNSRVNGSPTSQHCFGEAADFTVQGHDVNEVFNWIAFESGLTFHQVIHEFGRWVHVGARKTGENRGDKLRAYTSGGKTKYDHVQYPMN